MEFVINTSASLKSIDRTQYFELTAVVMEALCGNNTKPPVSYITDDLKEADIKPVMLSEKNELIKDSDIKSLFSSLLSDVNNDVEGSGVSCLDFNGDSLKMTTITPVISRGTHDF